MDRYQIDYEFRNLNAIQKQEIWRQKQVQIFYKSGKPIYNITEATQHIRFLITIHISTKTDT